jgi:hypothetical protein
MATTAPDPLAEIEAMRGVADALAPLGDDSRARVLRWATEHYHVGKRQSLADSKNSTPSHVEDTGASSGFGDLAELYNAASPTTDADRALVCGYFFQFVQGQADFTGQAINGELKNLGHGVGNITVAFNRLKFQKPALVMQVRKDGSSKQARKKYKVTAEGKKAVDAMLAGNGGGDE